MQGLASERLARQPSNYRTLVPERLSGQDWHTPVWALIDLYLAGLDLMTDRFPKICILTKASDQDNGFDRFLGGVDLARYQPQHFLQDWFKNSPNFGTI